MRWHRAVPPTLAFLLLAAAPPAQEQAEQASSAPDRVRVAVVNGCVRDGAIDFSKVGLGDGGLAEERTPGGRTPDGFRTPGGVRVQVRPVGVKLTSPRGGEAVIDTAGRIHLRDGSRTLPHRSGLRLHLADGAIVEILPGGTDIEPIAFVGIRGRDIPPQLLQGRVDLARRFTTRSGFRGRELHVLGDGTSFYDIVPLGPLAACERIFGPRDGDAPERAAIVVGDVLAVSLSELHMHAKLHAANDPALQQRCTLLAGLAAKLFPPGTESARPMTAVGEAVIPLPLQSHLRIAVRGSGPVALELHGPKHDVPLLEWTVTNTTHLHVVTEDPERSGGIRYAMQGLDIGRATAPIWAGDRASSSEVSRARNWLRGIGRAGNATAPVAVPPADPGR